VTIFDSALGSRMRELDSFVPVQLKQLARRCGGDERDEFAYPYPSVMEVIDIADQNDIAVLGVEQLQSHPKGPVVEAISGYEIPFQGDWKAFVKRNNVSAREVIMKNQRGEEHGYVLTSASQAWFGQLTLKVNRSNKKA
jgi:hypothetical protein